VTSIKILVLKSDIMPVIRRAIWNHADCCRNSCNPRDHYQECLTEKVENDRALKALSGARP
jgi:hypothetical protein